MLKRFFDPVSFTYSYLLIDRSAGQAVIIDPVLEFVEEYLTFLADHSLKLAYVLETHVHADHITGGSLLRTKTAAKTGVSEKCGAECADQQLNDGDIIQFGAEKVDVISTPGHTLGSVSYLWRDRIFTGDALLIGGCGRTDFQQGDARVLYASITKKLFTLPDETLLYPAHDYNGRFVSSIEQERTSNPRLAGKTEQEFVQIMNNLFLPDPKMMDIAISANQQCGNVIT